MLASPLLLLLTGCRLLTGPDVVLISIDTLRVDHVGAFAPDSPAATPHIDALAADGVLYSQAWSPISVTGPAFTSLMTGQEPGTHGVLMNVFRGGHGLSQETVTLAEQFQAEGFLTAAFLSGFTLRPKLGLRQGFQHYGEPDPRIGRRTGDITANRTIAWLAERKTLDRLFIWYHSFDVHGPLLPYEEAVPLSSGLARDPAALERYPEYQRIAGVSDPDFYARRYAAAVEFADAQVGRLVAALEESGRYHNALIVLVADHGESFTERDLWFDHGTHASPEQLHVPLVIKYPRNQRAGSRVDAPIGLADVAPTLLDALDLAPLPQADGRPGGEGRAARLLGESSHCKADAALDCAPRGPDGKELAWRSETVSVVRRSTPTGLTWDVYDRVQDPRELRPTGAPAPVEAQEIVQAMARDRLGRGLANPDAPGVELEPEGQQEAEALRALGYVE